MYFCINTYIHTGALIRLCIRMCVEKQLNMNANKGRSIYIYMYIYTHTMWKCTCIHPLICLQPQHPSPIGGRRSSSSVRSAASSCGLAWLNDSRIELCFELQSILVVSPKNMGLNKSSLVGPGIERSLFRALHPILHVALVSVILMAARIE